MSLSQSHDVNSLSWLIHTCDYFLSVTAFFSAWNGLTGCQWYCWDCDCDLQQFDSKPQSYSEKNAPCELAFKIKIANDRVSWITGSKNHDVDFPMSVSTEPITLNEDTPNEVQVRVITDVRGKITTILMRGWKNQFLLCLDFFKSVYN